MVSMYFMFAIIALIFSAMVAGIIGDCKRLQARKNAIKLPEDTLSQWLDKRDKIAFDAIGKED